VVWNVTDTNGVDVIEVDGDITSRLVVVIEVVDAFSPTPLTMRSSRPAVPFIGIVLPLIITAVADGGSETAISLIVVSLPGIMVSPIRRVMGAPVGKAETRVEEAGTTNVVVPTCRTDFRPSKDMGEPFGVGITSGLSTDVGPEMWSPLSEGTTGTGLS
jgi:hypothetical protein